MSDAPLTGPTSGEPEAVPVPWHLPRSLRDEALCLEPLAQEHWPGFLDSLAWPEIWRFSIVPMSSEADVRAYFEAALADAAAGRALPFAVLAASASGAWQFAGSTRIALVAPEHQRVEIGWSWLLPPFQRSGLNRRAKLLLLDYCFSELGCRRVEFKGDARNEQSRQALLGIGATFEGVLRRHMKLPDGSQRDSFYFSIIAEEWPLVRRALQDNIAGSQR